MPAGQEWLDWTVAARTDIGHPREPRGRTAAPPAPGSGPGARLRRQNAAAERGGRTSRNHCSRPKRVTRTHYSRPKRRTLKGGAFRPRVVGSGVEFRPRTRSTVQNFLVLKSSAERLLLRFWVLRARTLSAARRTRTRIAGRSCAGFWSRSSSAAAERGGRTRRQNVQEPLLAAEKRHQNPLLAAETQNP